MIVSPDSYRFSGDSALNNTKHSKQLKNVREILKFFTRGILGLTKNIQQINNGFIRVMRVNDKFLPEKGEGPFQINRELMVIA